MGGHAVMPLDGTMLTLYAVWDHFDYCGPDLVRVHASKASAERWVAEHRTDRSKEYLVEPLEVHP